MTVLNNVTNAVQKYFDAVEGMGGAMVAPLTPGKSVKGEVKNATRQTAAIVTDSWSAGIATIVLYMLWSGGNTEKSTARRGGEALALSVIVAGVVNIGRWGTIVRRVL